MQYGMDGLFSCKSELKNTSNQRSSVCSRASGVYTAKSDQDLCNQLVFTDSVKAELDEISKKYGCILQHQSDRNLPRTYFPKGICPCSDKSGLRNKKKISAHEESGLMLLLFLIFSSSWGEHVLGENFGNERCGSVVHHFELLLMYEEILKTESINKKGSTFAEKVYPIIS